MNMSKGASILKQYLQFLKSGKGFEKQFEKVKIITAANGNCKAEFTVQPEQTNAMNFLHGGFSAALCDIIAGIALLSHEREIAGVSVNMNMAYLKTAKVGELVEVEAKTLKAGKSLGFAEVMLKNKSNGDILVTATLTKYSM